MLFHLHVNEILIFMFSNRHFWQVVSEVHFYTLDFPDDEIVKKHTINNTLNSIPPNE
jgi:hypothetical protein